MNRPDQAEALTAMIDSSQLRPEEKALIEKPTEPLLETPLEQPAPVEWNKEDMPVDGL